jgi:nitrate/nitrite transporter NarK
MLAGMASVCLLRALILLPLAVTHPELRNTFEIVAALVWGLAGVGFVVGYRHSRLVYDDAHEANAGRPA